MRIVVLGLSITSSWGNGHATTFRALLKALAARGHAIVFLERDQPWYAEHRDLPRPPYCETHLYRDPDELDRVHGARIAEADVVLVGSYVPDGITVVDRVLERARGRVAFYDIDTPVTLAHLADGDCAYLARRQVPAFDVFFSFAGGPTLDRLERIFGARRAVALHCAVDPAVHRPLAVARRWDLGYLGTWSADRQPGLDQMLLAPARRRPDCRFAVVGALYPPGIAWPPSVERVEHLPPARHAAFYGAQRMTLNLTRADMVAAGWSPSVRLFEAAACGVPVLSDPWPGLETFFEPETEILVRRTGEEVTDLLDRFDERRRAAVASAARARVLAAHTADHRAATFEAAMGAAADVSRRRSVPA